MVVVTRVLLLASAVGCAQPVTWSCGTVRDSAITEVADGGMSCESWREEGEDVLAMHEARCEQRSGMPCVCTIVENDCFMDVED